MTLLDVTIVNVAIPGILGSLHATLDQVLWVLNAYSLLYAVLLINAPVGMLTMALAVWLVPDLRPGRAHRFDLAGVGPATLGLLGLVFGLIEGERYSWGQVWGPLTIPEIIGAGVAILALFIVQQARRQGQELLLPFAVFAGRNFTLMTPPPCAPRPRPRGKNRTSVDQSTGQGIPRLTRRSEVCYTSRRATHRRRAHAPVLTDQPMALTWIRLNNMEVIPCV